jgi:probable F420-dependent oxidoreductase
VRIGAIFPHFEFGADPRAVREYTLAAEDLGLAHIGADDHVVGPNPQRPEGYSGWTNHKLPFHEPFVLFGFMAGLTRRIEFATCVLILSQRQTVLAAKQAAELDILSEGRLRLGIGIGWNEYEYLSLGVPFAGRGRRIDEQIQVLRKLWTAELVDFQGSYHHIPDVGINPRPLQRPIPIWIGGQSDAAIRRAACLGDGWLPLYEDPRQAVAGLALLDAYLKDAGRSRVGLGLEARIPYGTGDPGQWRELLAAWQELGASHASLVATNCGLDGAPAHIAALSAFAKGIEKQIAAV